MSYLINTRVIFFSILLFVACKNNSIFLVSSNYLLYLGNLLNFFSKSLINLLGSIWYLCLCSINSKNNLLIILFEPSSKNLSLSHSTSLFQEMESSCNSFNLSIISRTTVRSKAEIIFTFGTWCTFILHTWILKNLMMFLLSNLSILSTIGSEAFVVSLLHY